MCEPNNLQLKDSFKNEFDTEKVRLLHFYFNSRNLHTIQLGKGLKLTPISS